ncbi:hypothetical protein MHYP_G00166820 [Metynnis hypsauchen]
MSHPFFKHVKAIQPEQNQDDSSGKYFTYEAALKADRCRACDSTSRASCHCRFLTPPLLRDVPPPSFMCRVRARIKQASPLGRVWSARSRERTAAAVCFCHQPAGSASHVPSGWM